MKNRLWAGLLALGVAIAWSAGDARAQVDALEVEVNRDAIDIARPHPVPRAIESVLVFSNRGLQARRVRCVAYDNNGAVVGRVATALPARGVRYLVASDFGRPFLGTANCWTRGRVVGSGFLLTPDLTNLPVETTAAPTDAVSADHAVRIRFDLLASR